MMPEPTPQDGTPPQEGTPQMDGTMVEIDGQQISMEELKKGYMRQSDYTKKTQEIANLRKEIEGKQQNPADGGDQDEAQLLSWLKTKGFVSKEDLDNVKTQTQMDLSFNELLKASPDLAPYEGAIKEIQKSTGKAYEDIIQQYGFMSNDKLQKAKESLRIPVGTRKTESQEKPISSATAEEYEAWKKEKGIGNRSVLEKQGSLI